MRIEVSDLPVDHYGLIRRSAARRVGMSDDQLAAAVRAGSLERLRPGVLAPAQPKETAATEAGKDARYRLACIAAATSTRAGKAPLSHHSAAALHRIGLLNPDRALVHVIRGTAGGSSIKSGRHRHAGEVPEEDIVVVDGIRVTSLRRTAVDIALAGDFAQALTVVDAVLRRGVERSELTEVLAGRRPEGAAIARRAIEAGSALAESVGESWSRAQMIDADLPLPCLQRDYLLEGHRYRPDFDWDGVLVDEFDGLVKYRGLLVPGEQAHEAVIREKQREDRFRRAHIDVVRWTWSTLVRGELIRLLRTALRHAGIRIA